MGQEPGDRGRRHQKMKPGTEVAGQRTEDATRDKGGKARDRGWRQRSQGLRSWGNAQRPRSQGNSLGQRLRRRRLKGQRWRQRSGGNSWGRGKQFEDGVWKATAWGNSRRTEAQGNSLGTKAKGNRGWKIQARDRSRG